MKASVAHCQKGCCNATDKKEKVVAFFVYRLSANAEGAEVLAAKAVSFLPSVVSASFDPGT